MWKNITSGWVNFGWKGMKKWEEEESMREMAVKLMLRITAICDDGGLYKNLE